MRALNKYPKPHQGKQEIARRVKQAQKLRDQKNPPAPKKVDLQ